MSAATLVLGGLTGGWGIARTLGYGIYRLEPLHAAGAQVGGAGVIYGAALLGGPVSTTQVVASRSPAPAPPSGHVRCAGTRARPWSWSGSITIPAAAAAGLARLPAPRAALAAIRG